MEDIPMYDVLCIGQSFCDLIFADLETFPLLGKESPCRDFFIKPGGAANTPAALTRLGLKTLFCTTIGNDLLGNIIYEYMLKTGIDMSAALRDDSYRTSVSAVLSTVRDRGFATYFAPFDYERVIKEIEKYAQQCSHIHAYLEDCLHIPIVDIARKYNKTLSVDASWDEKFKLSNIRDIVKGSNIFMTNEIESMSITGSDSVEEALELIGEYAEIAIVKLGKNGSLIKKGREVISVPAISGVEVADSTGAGDLYGAGFIYGFLKEWDLKNCAKFATASGNLAVTFYGGMDERYTLENVKHYYNLIKD
jgi:sugar/nucleoside kinase (ribokinase family)